MPNSVPASVSVREVSCHPSAAAAMTFACALALASCGGSKSNTTPPPDTTRADARGADPIGGTGGSSSGTGGATGSGGSGAGGAGSGRGGRGGSGDGGAGGMSRGGAGGMARGGAGGMSRGGAGGMARGGAGGAGRGGAGGMSAAGGRGGAGGTTMGGAGGASAGDAAGAPAVIDGGADSGADGAEAGVAASCGGVTCPRLFQLVEACRPSGSCVRATVPGLLPSDRLCYANGVKVRTSADPGTVPPTQSVSWTYPDGSACYSLDIAPALGGSFSFTWKTTAAGEIARGTLDSSGNVFITCDGTTSRLTDPRCAPPSSAVGCTPGECQ